MTIRHRLYLLLVLAFSPIPAFAHGLPDLAGTVYLLELLFFAVAALAIFFLEARDVSFLHGLLTTGKFTLVFLGVLFFVGGAYAAITGNSQSPVGFGEAIGGFFGLAGAFVYMRRLRRQRHLTDGGT